MKNLALTLAAALLIVTVGCGDSKSPMLTYVARSNSDGIPHLFTLNESNQQVTAVSIPIPDSAYYVASNSDASAVTYCRDIGTGDYEIFTMGTDGVEKQLTMNADACESVFSPDGKTIAFIATQSGDYQVYTMNVDGSNQAALAPLDAGTAEEYSPEFSPDGKSLVFYIVSYSGPKSAGQPHQGIRTNSWANQKHVRNAQAKRATVAPSTVSSSGWYVMGLSDTSPTLAYASEDLWGPAVFTGDGKGLLFTMWDGTEDNIFSVNLDGSNLTPLTTSTDTYNFSPVPYKSVIVFNRYNNDSQSWDIYLMNQDGSDQILVHSTADTSETLLDSYWYPWYE